MLLRGGSTTEVTTQNPFVVIFGQNDRQQNENKQTSHLFVVVLSLLFLMSRFFLPVYDFFGACPEALEGALRAVALLNIGIMPHSK